MFITEEWCTFVKFWSPAMNYNYSPMNNNPRYEWSVVIQVNYYCRHTFVWQSSRYLCSQSWSWFVHKIKYRDSDSVWKLRRTGNLNRVHWSQMRLTLINHWSVYADDLDLLTELTRNHLIYLVLVVANYVFNAVTRFVIGAMYLIKKPMRRERVP